MNLQQQLPEQLSEKEQRLQNINNALNTVTNLQTQLNGMSSQLTMILGNLGNLSQGLQENIQYLISEGNKFEEKNIELEGEIGKLTIEKEVSDNKVPPQRPEPELSSVKKKSIKKPTK